jgi:BCD family chlorophyll transporter-like MFS transporter
VSLRPFQLGLVHAALAAALVPINSTLNRVMIKELGVPATLVALLASLPYLLSPLQVAIGSWSDSHPFLGRRRSPYVAMGLLLCVGGVALAPAAAFLIGTRPAAGIAAAAAAFGAWGMGYNLAAVSYLALAAEGSGSEQRSGTVSVMWVMMILAIIATSLALGALLPDASPRTLARAFATVAVAALAAGGIGLAGLEPRTRAAGPQQKRPRWAALLRQVAGNRQATFFFVYLFVLLTAILGQDVLLEPFAGEVLGMPVAETSRLASVWGVFFLAAMVLARPLEARVGRRTVATAGAVAATSALLAIAASPWTPGGHALFYGALALLGAGAGLATIANLALMLDMTVQGEEGLYVGVWGISNALARVAGSASGGILRDSFGREGAAAGYAAGFGFLAALLLASLVMLPRIDVAEFRDSARRSAPQVRAVDSTTSTPVPRKSRIRTWPASSGGSSSRA